MQCSETLVVPGKGVENKVLVGGKGEENPCHFLRMGNLVILDLVPNHLWAKLLMLPLLEQNYPKRS